MSGHAGPKHAIDPLRKTVIVGLLIAAMVLLHFLAPPGLQVQHIVATQVATHDANCHDYAVEISIGNDVNKDGVIDVDGPLGRQVVCTETDTPLVGLSISQDEVPEDLQGTCADGGAFVQWFGDGVPAPSHHAMVCDQRIDPTGLLAFGFVVLAAFVVGELVEIIALPHITGYLLAGILLGPSFVEILPTSWRVPPFDHGILNHGVQEQLGLLNTLALGLIALTAGGELKVEQVRRGFLQIGGVLVGQTVTMMVSITAFIWAISGGIEAVSMPVLMSLDTMSALAIGGAIAAISLATSPAATIAVMNGMNADGPMSRTVMSAVVLKDVIVVVLFSIFGALAGMALANNPELGGVKDVLHGSTLQTYLFFHVLGSLFVGALLAGVLAAYLRWVAHEHLLFLVGLIYIGSYAVTHMPVGLDPVLMFIATGFVVSNFSSQGESLIHTLEQLALPVYVVFFTLAGAHLDLAGVAGVAPYAFALILIRTGALYVGVRAGAVVSGADVYTQRVGWMGFLSQAGVAIALSGQLRIAYGDLGGHGEHSVGAALSTLIIAGVAIHELVGPLALKVAIGMAGEAGSSDDAHDNEPGREEHSARDADADDADGKLAPWTAPDAVGDLWGPPLASASQALDARSSDIEIELQSLVRDIEQGPFAKFRADAQVMLRNLRREYLRHRRRVEIGVASEEDLLKIPRIIRSEQADLARRWRGIVLDRAARSAGRTWNPLTLIDSLDRIVDVMPELVQTPWEPHHFEAKGAEGAVMRLQRTALRVRSRVARMSGSKLAPRQVLVRTLCRYHISGRIPVQVEGIAALLVSAEAHLAARTRSLFDGLVVGYDAIAYRLGEQGSDADLSGMLRDSRAEIEEEFSLAEAELERVVQDGSVRAARVFGEVLQDIKRDFHAADTPDLSGWSRRYSRVFSKRATAESRLQVGTKAAAATTAAHFTVLALEFELVALEGRIKGAVTEHAVDLERLVRGRGPMQLQRVHDALDTCVAEVSKLLEQPASGLVLITGIRGATEPLIRTVSAAARETIRLRDHLAEDGSVAPLLDTLLAASTELTEHYAVPTRRIEHGEWRLPETVSTTDVNLREVVNAYVETAVTRNLSNVVVSLSGPVDALVTLLEELERLVAFNVELAGGELDAVVDVDAPKATVDLVREMVVGALTRSKHRIVDMVEEMAELPEKTRLGIHAAVLDELAELRAQIVDGQVSGLQMRIRDAASTRSLSRDAAQLGGLITSTGDQAWNMVRDALGEDRLALGRQALGLPSDEAVGVAPNTFALPQSKVALPVVYRRLFSEKALEAGDLLTGRAAEIQLGRESLSGARGGRFRAVAIVGPSGVGTGAAAQALVRGHAGRGVRVINLDGPVTVAQVDKWFSGAGEDMLHVIDGIAWMYNMRPGGFEPLQRFTDGVIADGGKNAWLVSCSDTVWNYASQMAPLRDAFSDVIRLAPLNVEQLTDAVIARHQMSGYGLYFEEQEDIGWQLQHLLAREHDAEERRRTAWFETLHAATGGVISDAFVLWMASVDGVDEAEGIVRVGTVPRPPIAALRALPDDFLLTLRQVLRQGWVDADLHASLFHRRRSDSVAHLAHLAHLGLLTNGPESTWIIPRHIKAPITWVLTDRGWME